MPTVCEGPATPPCSACNAPVAHRYTSNDALLNVLPFVWMCDQCVDPAIVQERIQREIAERRASGGWISITT